MHFTVELKHNNLLNPVQYLWRGAVTCVTQPNPKPPGESRTGAAALTWGSCIRLSKHARAALILDTVNNT